MNISRFEDLKIWQLTGELCKELFRLTSLEPFCYNYKLRDQMRASSGSIMDNIAEGFSRGGNKEFIQFLSVSNGSCGEVKSQSYRAFDYNYITEAYLNELLERIEKISRKTNSLISHLKKSYITGLKYKYSER